MSDISLMPVGYRTYKEARKKKDIYIMVSLIVIGAIVLAYIMLTFLNLIYMQELNALKVEKLQIEDRINSLQKYETMFNSVKNYENLVKNAVGDTPDWEIILGDLAGALPDSIWFDDISLKHEEDVVKCVIRGKAARQDIIAQWIDNIESLKYMQNISCKHINELEDKGRKYSQFEISADIVSAEISTKTVERISSGEGVKSSGG